MNIECSKNKRFENRDFATKKTNRRTWNQYFRENLKNPIFLQIITFTLDYFSESFFIEISLIFCVIFVKNDLFQLTLILSSKISKIEDFKIMFFGNFSLFFRIIEFRNFGFEIKMDIFGWKFVIFVNFGSDSRYKY